MSIKAILDKVDLKYLILAIWIGITMVYILGVGMSNWLVGYGEKINQLDKLEKQLILENQILESEIAFKSSLRYLSQEASRAGFIPATKIIYIR